MLAPPRIDRNDRTVRSLHIWGGKHPLSYLFGKRPQLPPGLKVNVKTGGATVTWLALRGYPYKTIENHHFNG